MATYIAICSNGEQFKVKAQTLNQAFKKVSDRPFYESGTCTIYMDCHPFLNTIGIDTKELPFLTFTMGRYGRYQINQHTNKKALAIINKQLQP